MIDPPLHVVDRDEDTFSRQRNTCFSIVLSLDPDILEHLVNFVDTVNRYNPLRIHLERPRFNTCAKETFITTEMRYRKPEEQSYFSFLFWKFSGKHPVWVHLWDTSEHDVFRRDFECPSYMDSSICGNRLWIRQGQIRMVNRGFDVENPHGEFVKELDLNAAIDCINKKEWELAKALTEEVGVEFTTGDVADNFFDEIMDVEQVYVPRQLLGILAYNTWMIRHFDHNWVDARRIKLSHLHKFVDIDDEVPLTIAVPTDMEEHMMEDLLPTYQMVSMSLKIVADLMFSDASRSQEQLDFLMSQMVEGVPHDTFLSAFMQQELKKAGLQKKCQMRSRDLTKHPTRLKFDWTKPFSIASPKEYHIWREAYEERFGDTDAGFNSIMADLKKEIPTVPESLATGFGESRQTTESLREKFTQFREAFDGQHTDGGLYEDLEREEIEQLDDLDDFDDFVEYYASHHMGMSAAEVALYVQTMRKFEREESVWDQYNDDSDYKSE